MVSTMPRGSSGPSPPWLCQLHVASVLALLSLPHLAFAAASCVSPPPGADQSLYSACLGLSSQLATMTLPSNGASVVLTTQVELPVSTSTVFDPFGFPTAVVTVTGTSQTSAASAAPGTMSGPSSSPGASATAQGGAGSSTPSPVSSTGSAISTLSTTIQSSVTPTPQASGQSRTGSSSASSGASSSGAAAATSSPGVTQNGVNGDDHHYRNTVVIPVAVVCTVVPVLLITALACFCYRRRKRRRAMAGAVAFDNGEEDRSVSHEGHDWVDSGTGLNEMAEVKATGRDPRARNPATAAGFASTERGVVNPDANNAVSASIPSPAAEGTAAASAYHSAKPSLGNNGPSNVLAATGAAGAVSAVSRPKSRSSSQSRPGSASRLAGWLPGRSRADSRTASRHGTGNSSADASGRASITSEQPPALPGMPAEMGSGKWFDGNSGPEYSEHGQAASVKAGSSIYDDRSANVALAPSIRDASEPGLTSSAQGRGLEDTASPRPLGLTATYPNPFQTPQAGNSISSGLEQRQTSYSTHRSSDVIPVGGSASTAAAAAARDAEDESLFGPYRPPTPYDELSMMTSARARGSTSNSYTSPSAVGNVVQGAWSNAAGGNYSRPMASQAQSPNTTVSQHGETSGARSGMQIDTSQQHAVRTTSSAHASSSPINAQQVMYYPSQEEARTFDFGRGPGSPIGDARETFFDASEDQ